MTRREILKRLGIVGVAGVTGAAFGDEVVADGGKLPADSVGDPNNVWFGWHIFPLDPTMTDGPSAYVKDGKIIQPQVELPLFHTADVVVVVVGALGAATLRRDGFTGLVAVGRGTVLTKKIKFTGGHLFVNGECNYGSITAEVLDGNLQPIPGFSLADCTAVRYADTTKRELVFKGGGS